MKKSKELLSVLMMITAGILAGCSVSGDSGESVTDPVEEHDIGIKKATDEKEVGDIVFKDGTATPYTSGMSLTKKQKNAAIAIIFYKGKGLNNGSDTSTIRTLGVGLKHSKTGLAWCTESADAYGKNITTIKCSATKKGNKYTFTGDKNGSNYLEMIEAEDGINDTEKEANYPSFYFAKNYKKVTGSNVKGSQYDNGWYFPSMAESYQIYLCMENKVFDIDAAIEALGGDKFGDNALWTASSYGDKNFLNYATAISYKSGSLPVQPKLNNSLKVCCIREFN